MTYFKEITSRNSFKSNNGIGSSHGTDSSDSKPNELVPESYSDSDSGAGVTTPLIQIMSRLFSSFYLMVVAHKSYSDARLRIHGYNLKDVRETS